MKLLVIGAGSIGERHLRVFQQLGRCKDIAFCEPHDERRAEIAARYNIQHVYPDLTSALDNRTYDIAVIATPAPTHIAIGCRLAERGIHHLVEKPLSVSFDGLEHYLRLVSTNKVVVAVGYTHRAHPAIASIKHEIASGRYGRPLQFRASCGQPFATLRPAYKDVYFARHELGGGAINDMITHFYSVADWLVGPINRLVTDAGHQRLDGVTVEDTVHTLTRHAGGAMGTISLNLYQHPNETTVTVVCERGTLRADYAGGRWSTMVDADWTHNAVDVQDRDHVYRLQNTAFLDAVAGRGKVLCSLQDAARTLRVNIASHRSAADCTWQQVGTE